MEPGQKSWVCSVQARPLSVWENDHMKHFLPFIAVALIALSVTAQQNERERKKPLMKYVEVFGLRMYATDAASDDKVLHAASVFAEWLDSDEDGVVDNQKILDAMLKNKATMVAAQNSEDLRAYNIYFPNWQNVWTNNVRRNGEKGMYDEALEEILHLITDYGWEAAYPKALARKRGTLAAKATDIARGGYFKEVPERYPEDAWFTYYDKSCGYGCMIAEYLHWGMSAILGGQDYEGTLDRGGQEWPLRTRDSVEKRDKALFALLTDPQYKLPTVLPDAQYGAKKLKIQRVEETE